MYYGDHMNGWGWALMSISTLVLWALLITVVVLLARYASGPQSSHTPGLSAEEILAQRLARGEIDTEEYRTRLDTVRGIHPPSATR